MASMNLTPKTKLLNLLREYPFLTDFLVELSPKYAGLKNPVLRNTLGRTASLGKIAALGGLDVNELLSAIQAEIVRQSGDELAIGTEGLPLTREQRRDVLKGIIADLHAGADADMLKQRFAELIEDVGAGEVAEMEQELIDAGMPQSEITRLCDVHLEIFRDSLADQPLPEMPAGHPVHTFMAENAALLKVAEQLRGLLEGLGDPPSGDSLTGRKAELEPLLEMIALVDLHYLRKENQLFPFLEKHGVSGPPQVMWTIHDQVRAHLRQARQALSDSAAEYFAAELSEGLRKLVDMVDKEQMVLLPMALERLSEEEWLQVWRGEEHIGFALIERGTDWPPPELAQQAAVAEPVRSSAQTAPPAEPAGFASVLLNFQTGVLTPEQANLLFNHLPVEISFTDENHIVRYFSEGRERIFPRSPGVIGRSVEKCHPPRSVHMVREILSAFERGERDVAEFWLELSGRFIHIRYFAVRDAAGRFRGTMEVVQDVTAIRALEGQRKLLEWE